MRCPAVIETGLAIDPAEQLEQLLMLCSGEFTVDLPLFQGALLALGGVAIEDFNQAVSSRCA